MMRRVGLGKMSVARLLGLTALGILLWRTDLRELMDVMSEASPVLLAIVVLLNLPQALLKVLRWRCLLRTQGVHYGLRPAFLAYLGSVFVGLLTPGRIGEAVKAGHVTRDCELPIRSALSSVLADRLFDVYALLFVGGFALITLPTRLGFGGALGIGWLLALMTLGLVTLLHPWTYRHMQTLGRRLGKFGRELFKSGGWVESLRDGLKLTPTSAALTVGLTIAAYASFSLQVYLVALSLRLDIGFITAVYSMTLGSLAALLPISILGLGTREAVLVSYLGTEGIPSESALAFSLLLFLTYYLVGGLMGGVAWWLKPLPLTRESLRGLIRSDSAA